MKWLVLVLAFVLVACATPAQDYDTNAQLCFHSSADHDILIGACTWLLDSGQLSEGEIPIAYKNRGITSEPVPDPTMIGSNPATMTATVIAIGRSRSKAPATTAWRTSRSRGM